MSRKRKPGRPSQGLTESTKAAITPELKHWLEDMIRTHGFREGEVVRLALEEARSKGWTPIGYFGETVRRD